MIVRMTRTPASVKPCSLLRSQLVVRHIVERLSLGLALHIDDAAAALIVCLLRLGWLGRGIVLGAGLILNRVPVRGLRDGIGGDPAEVMRNEILQIAGKLLLVGVVVVDRLAHLMQISAQRAI